MKGQDLTIAFALVFGMTMNNIASAQEAVAKPVAATPTKATPASATPASSTPVAARAQSVTVQLSSKTEIAGTLLDTTTIPLRTSFGVANLPLSEVAGIRMANEGTAVTTVVMHNGDSFTGATELNSVSVETEWGKADIKGDNIVSLLFAPGLAWTSKDDLNGKRWGLVIESSKANTANKTTSTPNGSSIRPVSGQAISSGSVIQTSGNSFSGGQVINGQFYPGR